MMRVLLAPAVSGLWNIRRGNLTLFRDLPLAPAIKLARQLARDEHVRCGRDMMVEMLCADAPILLAQYVRRHDAVEPGFDETASAA